ncbi:PucR family transcriptional regulator ligand-binding domain-containing protein [Nocardioides sp. B-3]|uniref:PucR family transcriptional regulator ligand-binding domain-containing protein n=1 Tax=Nocardioides sp. B-3 TaxID=2895565 RepID=UPI002342BF0B|nr:PucR family transcriptional regulator ligand-binding domain-containing protein [Nocardioides sp. B-3]
MVTMAELVGTAPLSLQGVHLPEPGADIRWVATSELADPAPFLEGGEVLLTTGPEMRGWRSQWTVYVERLRARAVVGPGFATGLTHRTIPAGLVAACRTRGLNLFEVPRDTTFVAISRAVASMLESDAEGAARSSLKAQQELTRAALSADESAAVVARLASIVRGAAAPVGRDAVAPTGVARDAPDLDAVAIEVERIRPQGLRAAASVQTGSGTLVVQPVGVARRPVAHLAVYVPGRAGDADRAAITTAVALLGPVAQSRAVRRDTDRGLRMRALELLLEGDVRTAAMVLEATAAGAPVLEGRVVVARASGPDALLDEALGPVEDDALLAGRAPGELWVVDGPRGIGRHLTTMSGRGLLVGVGDPEGVEDAVVSWTNAAHSLASATTAVPVVRWEQLVREGPLTILDRERSDAFAASFLARIDDEALVTTLRSFLRHHGSRLKVSRGAGDPPQHRRQPDRADRGGPGQSPRRPARARRGLDRAPAGGPRGLIGKARSAQSRSDRLCSTDLPDVISDTYLEVTQRRFT